MRLKNRKPFTYTPLTNKQKAKAKTRRKMANKSRKQNRG